jgi:hypothetical protein
VLEPDVPAVKDILSSTGLLPFLKATFMFVPVTGAELSDIEPLFEVLAAIPIYRDCETYVSTNSLKFA